MKEILIYCEGGGQWRATREMLTKGFREFFKELDVIAKQRKISFRPLACGSRYEAYQKFQLSLKTNKEAFNILLVDAEAPVEQLQQPWLHLNKNDNWNNFGCTNEHCHLMVQTMEAWFFADHEALTKFYGKEFQAKPFLKISDIEIIDKNKLEPTLKKATRKTTKGEYHKIQHGAQLLGLIAPIKVRQASIHCDQMFKTISSLMTDAG